MCHGKCIIDIYFCKGSKFFCKSRIVLLFFFKKTKVFQKKAVWGNRPPLKLPSCCFFNASSEFFCQPLCNRGKTKRWHHFSLWSSEFTPNNHGCPLVKKVGNCFSTWLYPRLVFYCSIGC